MQTHATGGIYIKAQPSGSEVFIDEKLGQKTGLFNDSIFMQNLLPGNHSVLVKKTGYFDYQKNIPVVGKEVTKLENIFLIKQNFIFNKLSSNAINYSISPNSKTLLSYFTTNKIITIESLNLQDINLAQKTVYSIPNQTGEIINFAWSGDSLKVILTIKNNAKISYFYLDLSNNVAPSLITFLDKNSSEINFNQQNNQQLFYIKNNQLFHTNILANASALPSPAIINNLISYKLENSDIIWLSKNGNLYKSDFNGNLVSALSLVPYLVNTNNQYKILSANQNIFIKENDTLLLLNQETKILENFYNPVKDFKISPNGQKILYYNDYEILLYVLSPETKKIFLNTFTEKITDCFWLNSDYIILKSKDKIKISEIDKLGNINIVDLPDKISTINGELIDLKNPKINFDTQFGKLYIFSDGQIFSSEKITP